MGSLVQVVSSVFPLVAAVALLLLILRIVRIDVEWRGDE